MISFDDAQKVLNEAAEALPEEIFRDLNGGINLLPDAPKDEDDGDMYTLGHYFHNALGRYVNIYYGSFEALYGTMSDSKIAEKMKKTLYHELTHHIESLAGDRSLERDDELYMEEYEALHRGDELVVENILFICRDNAFLSPVAEALWNKLCKEQDIPVPCSSAAQYDPAESISDKALRAAEEAGIDLSPHTPQKVSFDLMSKHSVIFCMTEEDADDLADEFSRFDARIYALGKEDIFPPETELEFKEAIELIKIGLDSIADELAKEDEEK